jgi:hypothetical protein
MKKKQNGSLTSPSSLRFRFSEKLGCPCPPSSFSTILLFSQSNQQLLGDQSQSRKVSALAVQRMTEA